MKSQYIIMMNVCIHVSKLVTVITRFCLTLRRCSILSVPFCEDSCILLVKYGTVNLAVTYCEFVLVHYSHLSSGSHDIICPKGEVYYSFKYYFLFVFHVCVFFFFSQFYTLTTFIRVRILFTKPSERS